MREGTSQSCQPFLTNAKKYGELGRDDRMRLLFFEI